MQKELQTAIDILKASENVVMLTGAGMSTAAGIPDFRSASGLWACVDPSQVASITAFEANPKRFWQFYRERFDILEGKQPGVAHGVIARWEEQGLVKGVITQNVDSFHQLAGSKVVAEMHGRLHDVHCSHCHARQPWETLTWVDELPMCQICHDPQGIMRPGIVLFGESLPDAAIALTQQLLGQCDTMIVVGSSLRVYPVAGLPREFMQQGGKVIVINDQPTPYRDKALHLIGELNQTLAMLQEQLQH